MSRREPGAPAWAERGVRLLVRAYPPAFRAAYGSDVAQCVRDARRARGEISPLDALRFWAGVVADMARQAAVERVAAAAAAATRSVAHPRVPRHAGFALLAAAVGNVAYDVGSVRNSMGVLALVLTAVAVTAGGALVRRGTRSR